MNFSIWMQNFWKSPKSTFTGLLGAGIAITIAIIALPAKASAPVVVLAVLRALIDFTKQDAGTTLAVPPGSDVPQQVPSHEIPDDPNAIVVKK